MRCRPEWAGAQGMYYADRRPNKASICESLKKHCESFVWGGTRLVVPPLGGLPVRIFLRCQPFLMEGEGCHSLRSLFSFLKPRSASAEPHLFFAARQEPCPPSQVTKKDRWIAPSACCFSKGWKTRRAGSSGVRRRVQGQTHRPTRERRVLEWSVGLLYPRYLLQKPY